MAVVVLGVGLVVFALTSHVMARAAGEKVLWARWNAGARAAELTPDEAMGEA